MKTHVSILSAVALALVLLMPTTGICGTASDDFEDGVLGSWWYVFDGAVTDADETGGGLHLADSSPALELGGDVLTLGQAAAYSGDVTVTVTFDGIDPPVGTMYGVSLSAQYYAADYAGILVAESAGSTYILFVDEGAFLPIPDPPLAVALIGSFGPSDTITLELRKVSGTVTAWWSLNGAPVAQLGVASATLADPFVFGVFGMNDSDVTNNPYDFEVLDAQMTGSTVPDVTANGGPDTFTDDFDSSATYLLPVTGSTKWTQIAADSGTFSEDTDARGAGDHAARVEDTDLSGGGPLLGAEKNQIFDTSAVVAEVEIGHNAYGTGMLGIAILDDDGNLIDAIGAAVNYSLLDGNSYLLLFALDPITLEPVVLSITAPLSPYIPGDFHNLRFE